MTETAKTVAKGATCTERVYSDSYYMPSRLCGLPAKGLMASGKPGCGRHLAGERRSAEARRRWEQEWEGRRRAAALAAAKEEIVTAAINRRLRGRELMAWFNGLRERCDDPEKWGSMFAAAEAANHAFDDAVSRLLALQQEKP